MIGAARMWAIRMYAPRYWMKVGADPVGGFQSAWARGINVLLNARAPQ